ncbi:hypothetical protein BX600DRAFT_517165 [Xylariales sp. PMI_506]|nr:hypothetical protein BX600DRAFT_517165 [Xylariales sp. PMI_506]
MWTMLASRLVPRTDCDAHPNLCVMPAITDKATPIAIGVVSAALVIGLLCVLTFLHFRRKKRDAREWTKDPQELDDYGMGVDTGAGAGRGPREPQKAYHQNDLPSMKDEESGLDLGHNRKSSMESQRELARNLRQFDNTTLPSKAEAPHSMV